MNIDAAPAMRGRFVRLTRAEYTLLLAVLIYSFVPSFGGLVRILDLALDTGIVPSNPRAQALPWPVILHILGSFVFCLFGALQFVPSLRNGWPVMHRRLGLCVALCGVLSAGTGLWMTLFYEFPATLQGPVLFWSRLVFGAAMIALIPLAILFARAGQFQRHQAAMMRAYAIGQGASSQAVLGLAFILMTGADATGFVRDILMVSAWCLNLLVAELLMRRRDRAHPASTIITP